MKGFLNFVREQGVVGLAVGFLLGGSVSKVVTSFVTDVINPIIGIIGNTKNLEKAYLQIGEARLTYGHFLSELINFLIIAAVVYYFIKGFGLDKIDKKKDAPLPPTPPKK